MRVQALSPVHLLQVFAHSAQMEWHSEHNDKVPRNIYELGLKTFAKERRFVSAYATFLLSQVCAHAHPAS